MAKTSITAFTSRFKRKIDYDITDSDLDTLCLDWINGARRLMKQWFVDNADYDEIGSLGEVDTVADQEYIDIATDLPLYDDLIVATERTNDRPIQVISYEQYKIMCPDPTVNKSETPDYATQPYNGRIYLYPTPSTTGITLYFDYIRLLEDLVSTDDLDFEDKYDMLLEAMCKKQYVEWNDDSNSQRMQVANTNLQFYKKQLIRVKNIGQLNQVASRRSGYIGPRKQLSSPVYGYGVTAYGSGAYGV